MKTFLALALALATSAAAQPARVPPHVGYAYPAGGQQGTTVTLSLGGQNLAGPVALYFSGSGLEAKVLGYDRPLTQKEINDLREKMQQLQDRRAAARAAGADGKEPFTAADEAQLNEIRVKLATRPNRQANPALAETVTLELALAADAVPGERELRLKTAAGLSNPIAFRVGALPECTEPVITATMNIAPRPNRAPEPRAARVKAAREITLPTVVNGQIMPGEVDRFRFTARAGQRLTVAAEARALMPFLADAVPGWFQATLALHDAQGRELAYDDDFRFNPDPVLLFEIPADGDYTIEIKDAIYRGREDFVYRIAVGELPFVKNIFPLGARAGGSAKFELAGWNLPARELAMDLSQRTPGICLLSVRQHDILSNSARFALDAQPDCAETESNDTRDHAQLLALPTRVNGRIGAPGDRDVFRFEGRAGMEIVAEVLARRLGSPLDSVLELTDAAGRRITANDDHDDPAAALLTHQADSRLSVTLPADGIYFLQLADGQQHGGAEYGYRLRVGAPQPDFELRVVPATINVRAGTSVPVVVHALRRDGFKGEIALRLENAPRGFALNGARIPAGEDSIRLTLTAPPAPSEEPYLLGMAGLAMIAGKPVTHRAIPAEDMMQAFAYRHLVPARAFVVAVAGRGASFRIASPLPLRIPAGGRAVVRVSLPSARLAERVMFELSEPTKGLATTGVTPGHLYVDVEVSADARALKPGQQGNLILNAIGERGDSKNGKAAERVQRNALGTVPAIPFIIVSAGGDPST